MHCTIIYNTINCTIICTICTMMVRLTSFWCRTPFHNFFWNSFICFKWYRTCCGCFCVCAYSALTIQQCWIVHIQQCWIVIYLILDLYQDIGTHEKLTWANEVVRSQSCWIVIYLILDLYLSAAELISKLMASSGARNRLCAGQHAGPLCNILHTVSIILGRWFVLCVKDRNHVTCAAVICRWELIKVLESRCWIRLIPMEWTTMHFCLLQTGTCEVIFTHFGGHQRCPNYYDFCVLICFNSIMAVLQHHDGSIIPFNLEEAQKLLEKPSGHNKR